MSLEDMEKKGFDWRLLFLCLATQCMSVYVCALEYESQLSIRH